MEQPLVPPPPLPAQRTNRKRSAQGVYSCDISLEDLMQQSHLPSHKAAQALGLGITAFKRLCRKRGVPRWPYARLKAGTKQVPEPEFFKAGGNCADPQSGSSQPSGSSEDTFSSGCMVPTAAWAGSAGMPAAAAAGASSLLRLAEAAEEGSPRREMMPAPTRPMACTVPRQQQDLVASDNPLKLPAAISRFVALTGPLGSIPAPGSPDKSSHLALPSPRHHDSPFAPAARIPFAPTLQYAGSAPLLGMHGQAGSSSGALVPQGSWPCFVRIAPRQGSALLPQHPCSAFQPYSSHSMAAGARVGERAEAEPAPAPAGAAPTCHPQAADFAPGWVGPAHLHGALHTSAHPAPPAELPGMPSTSGGQQQERRRKDVLVLAAVLEQQRHEQCMQRLRRMMDYMQQAL